MPRLSVLSGREVVRGLQRLGFKPIRQRGSHTNLRKGDLTVIAPDHSEMRRGMPGSILKMGQVSVDDLVDSVSH
jgi:predicted RNA binding protein YcfA (HicA-like mRNA interferase family)